MFSQLRSLVEGIDGPQPTVALSPPDTHLGDKPWIVVNQPAHTLTHTICPTYRSSSTTRTAAGLFWLISA
jgi:hypothetical protein